MITALPPAAPPIESLAEPMPLPPIRRHRFVPSPGPTREASQWMIVLDNGSEIEHTLSPKVVVKPTMLSIQMECRELWNDGVYSASAW